MKYLFVIFLCCLLQPSFSQKVLVKDIQVTGNQKTKSNILLRELTFGVGDSLEINQLPILFEKNSRYLIGTYLIYECKFTYKKIHNEINITMDVVEPWYIYPIPIFELADRNFNVWWDEYNHDFTRTNIGVQMKHYNFTGRRDQLKLTGQYGYTQKLELDYKIPGVNPNKTMGFFFNLYFKRSKETPFTTINNKLKFLKEDQFYNQSFRAFIGLSLRPKLRTTHSIRLLFRKNKVSDLISTDYNPNFFSNGQSSQKFFSFQYKFVFDTRDFEPYPTKGILFSSKLSKIGLGIFNELNYAKINHRLLWYIPLFKNFTLASFTKINLNICSTNIPYNQIQALGYRENQLHGYEYYVIDGAYFGFIKTSFRYRFLNKTIHWKKLMPIQSFKIMPLELFATMNNDFGYVHTSTYDQLGMLNNKVIWGKGIGLDIVFYTTFVFRIDYSINNINEKGFFFHFNPYF